MSADRSTATTDPPAASTATDVAPAPAPTSSTTRPASDTGDEATMAALSGRYTRSGPRAHASAHR